LGREGVAGHLKSSGDEVGGVEVEGGVCRGESKGLERLAK
jgi:hypothetical protein